MTNRRVAKNPVLGQSPPPALATSIVQSTQGTSAQAKRNFRTNGVASMKVYDRRSQAICRLHRKFPMASINDYIGQHGSPPVL